MAIASLRMPGRAAQKFKSAKSAPSSNLRRDIQGLRAIAVVSVVLDHMTHWPSGGFVGVDIFFVISGFLITGLLLREHERTGRISFVGFYRRRVKRIMPAAALVLITTVAFSFAAFSPSRFLGVVSDSIWAFFFSANWHFAVAGTDYFQADGPVSPLQHFWSLAVEEQFYFVWPWLMVLIFFAMRGRAGSGTASRVVVGVVISGISVASFAWALYETVGAPTVAYFSTFSRAWELGIGALLAVLAPALRLIPNILRPALAWIGLLGMGASFFAISSGSLFPAPSAALPVVSAALVILAGTGGPQKFLAPLTNKVSTYIGDVSYSLYLWHFPFIVIGGVLLGQSVLFYVVASAGSLLAAIYTYHLLEDPIRKSGWLDRKKRHQKNHAPVSTAYKMTALSLLAVVTACTVAVALVPQAKHASGPVAVSVPTKQAAASVKLSSDGQKAQASIALALNSAAWPDKLEPSLDDPGSGMAPEMKDSTCMNPTSVGDPNACTSGDGGKLAIVLGDSVAASWTPAVRAALLGTDFRVRALTFSDCPFIQANVLVDGKPAETKRCNDARQQIVDHLSAIKPSLVILSSFQGDTERLASGAKGSQAIAEWQKATAGAIVAAKASGAKVVVLGSNPAGKSVANCATRTSAPSDCADVVSSGWFQKSEAEKAAAKASGATYVDPRLWLCSPTDACPLYVGNQLVRWDSVHLTAAYAKTIGPLLAETLAPILKS